MVGNTIIHVLTHLRNLYTTTPMYYYGQFDINIWFSLFEGIFLQVTPTPTVLTQTFSTRPYIIHLTRTFRLKYFRKLQIWNS